jgi:hypothetical protein
MTFKHTLDSGEFLDAKLSLKPFKNAPEKRRVNEPLGIFKVFHFVYDDLKLSYSVT